MTNNRVLIKVLQAYRLKENEFHRALAKEFPVGCEVTFRHGHNERIAEVVRHSSDRIQLRGATGNTYWKYWDRTFQRVPDFDDSKEL